MKTSIKEKLESKLEKQGMYIVYICGYAIMISFTLFVVIGTFYLILAIIRG